MKKKPTFTCPYNDKECIHVNTSGMSCDVACPDCEIYKDNHGIRMSPGCLVPAVSIILIIIILLI